MHSLPHVVNRQPDYSDDIRGWQVKRLEEGGQSASQAQAPNLPASAPCRGEFWDAEKSNALTRSNYGWLVNSHTATISITAIVIGTNRLKAQASGLSLLPQVSIGGADLNQGHCPQVDPTAALNPGCVCNIRA
jgi:hypothetical protein